MLSYQYRPIPGTIDINDIKTIEQFSKFWKAVVGIEGNFRLRIQDHGFKGLGKIAYHGGVLTIPDKRAIIWRVFREYAKRDPRDEYL